MIQQTTLPSGLTLISEKRTGLPSLALSYTIVSGSRDEATREAGLHHFIEHMVFKGNPRYSQEAIAQVSDQMGGHLNAFTAKEITQYYTKAIPEHFDTAFDLLSNLIFRADFPAAEFEKEKEVIIQEIRESRDTPDSQAFDLFYERVFPGSSLGASITGDEASLADLSRDTLVSFHRQIYRPEKTVLTVVGAIEHTRLLDMVGDFFLDHPAAAPLGFHPQLQPDYHPGSHRIEQESLEQVYHLVGMPAPRAAHKKRAAYMLVNEMLGGGMSSRLNQRIREEMGLVYSVSSFYENYRDCGLQMIFAVTQGDKLEAYRSALIEELQGLRNRKASPGEVDRVRDHLKASTILGLESNVSQSRLLTNQWLYQQSFQTLEEMSAEIAAIGEADIAEVLDEFFSLEEMAELRYGSDL
jgi:predicted Zn-dependent peptidase